MSLTLLGSLILLACALTPSTGQTTCRGRCGIEYYRGYLCQCDYNCIVYKECCVDFEAQCTTKNSCRGRCGETFKRGQLCSCDADCVKYKQCCPDYQIHCDAEEQTLDEATVSEGNDEDNYEVPLVSSTSNPQDDPNNDLHTEATPVDEFPNTEAPGESLSPESMSGYGSSPAEPLDQVNTQATLITDTPQASSEAVTVVSTTATTPSENKPTEEQSTTFDVADGVTPTESPDSGSTSPQPTTAVQQVSSQPMPTLANQPESSPTADTAPQETTSLAQTVGPTEAASEKPEVTPSFSATNSEPSQDISTTSVVPTAPSQNPSATSVPPEASQESFTTPVPPAPSQDSSESSVPPQESSTTPVSPEPSQESSTTAVPPEPSQESSTTLVPPEPSQESSTTLVPPEPSQDSSTTPVPPEPPQDSSTTAVPPEPPQESSTTAVPPEPPQDFSTNSAPQEQSSTASNTITTSVPSEPITESYRDAESSVATIPDSTMVPPSIQTTLSPMGHSSAPDLQNPSTSISPVGSEVDAKTTARPLPTEGTTAAEPSVDPLTATKKPTIPQSSEPTPKPQDKPKPSNPQTTTAPVDKATSKPGIKPVDALQTVDDSRNYQADDSNDTDLCSGRPVSAVTTLRNGTIAVFRGHYFWFLDRNRAPGPARGITQTWGVPSPIDTVFTRCNCQGKTYIFKGNQYWRFNNDHLDHGFPKAVETGFDGLRGHITAALSVPEYRRRTESVYFFKRGGFVQKYSYRPGGSSCNKKPHYAIYTVRSRVIRQAVSLLGPTINIRTSWRGFPTTITSAVSVPTNREPEGYKYYVFSRSKSYNVRMDSDRPVIASPREYPSAQNNNFIKCPKTL